MGGIFFSRTRQTERIGLYFILPVALLFAIGAVLGYFKSGFLISLMEGFNVDGKIDNHTLCCSTVCKYSLFIIAFLLLNGMIMLVFRTLNDMNKRLKKFNLLAFLTANFLGLYLFMNFAYYLGFVFIDRKKSFLYKEDGFFENMTALFFALAALVMLLSIIKMVKTTKFKSTIAKQLTVVFCLAGILFFLIGMEEISWGQRIFGWETPEYYSQINYQHETNVHNLINPLLPILYIILIIPLTISGIVSLWLNYRDKNGHLLRFILPHPSLIPLTCLVAISIIPFTSYYHEMMEELISIIALFYALRIRLLVREI